MRLECLVSFRREITGVGVKRLEQTVQSAVGHLRDVGLLNVFAAYAREDFAINLQLAVRAVVRGGMDAAQRSDNNEQQYGKGGDEYRCFNFHGHLYSDLLPEGTTSCELNPL